MSGQSRVRKKQRNIRQWAKEHRKEIFDAFGHKCAICNKKKDIEIHHKEYKVGIEYLQLLCRKHHSEFHRKEFRLRLLDIMKRQAIKSKEKNNTETIDQYIMDLEIEIQKLKSKGIYIIPNVITGGLPKEDLGL